MSVSTFLDENTIISMKAVLMTQRQKKFLFKKSCTKVFDHFEEEANVFRNFCWKQLQND